MSVLDRALTPTTVHKAIEIVSGFCPLAICRSTQKGAGVLTRRTATLQRISKKPQAKGKKKKNPKAFQTIDFTIVNAGGIKGKNLLKAGRWEQRTVEANTQVMPILWHLLVLALALMHIEKGILSWYMYIH